MNELITALIVASGSIAFLTLTYWLSTDAKANKIAVVMTAAAWAVVVFWLSAQ